MKTKTKGVGKAHKPNSPTPQRRPKDRGLNEDDQKPITNSEDDDLRIDHDSISQEEDGKDKRER